MIAIENLTKQYGELTVLRNVTLKIPDGCIYGLAGQSGAGKSTLLRCINGLETFQGGRIVIDGQAVSTASDYAARKARKGIGMVFQSFSLLERLNVYENVALPMKCWGYKKAEVDGRVRELLALVGLEDKLRAYPAQLSGGQKQRVAIARMLLQDTPVLIFDDSLSAVDAETDAAIRDALHSRRHGTMFLISHRIATIRKSDLILVLDKGRVVQMGTHDTLAAQEGLYRRVCAIQNELPQAASPKGGEA